jgi:aminoglycoside phosphotransferase family enzyme
MRRLPADRMLDNTIRNNSFSEDDLRKIAALLAEFYTEAARAPWSGLEYRMRLTVDVRATRSELKKPEYSLPGDVVEALACQQLTFLRQNSNMFEDRIAAGRVVDAHGDLRPEHICLESEPVVIDCLEFNHDLRTLDAASELMFLALECERLGQVGIGPFIMNVYSQKTGDVPRPELLNFYKSYHACIRAKIAVWHLKDAEPNDAARWTERAKEYLRLGLP